MRAVVARVLLVVPNHTVADRETAQRLRSIVEPSGHQAVVPSASGDARARLAGLKKDIQGCDAVLAVLEGAAPDPAVAATVAYARSARRPCLGLRSDERPTLDPLTLSLFDDVVKFTSWDASDTRQKILDFLGGVRVFAGALVRDSVPSILKQEGRELRFRQVADTEYPHVLKRKLVETAQRLEDADFGVEQEEIADLLELLETLINLRRYDKDSLRSIKEGKWRKRGGFAKGYLLDEEPVLSSR